LVAVIIKAVTATAAVAVPERTPVLVFRTNPEGKAGEILYEVIAPPVFVGVIAVNATFTTPL
jgi:hypothetical protein